MRLRDRVKRLEQLFTEGRTPPTAVVFGLGPAADWDVEGQRYRSEQGLQFEVYATIGDPGVDLRRVKDLAQLRQAAETYKFGLLVMPAETAAGDLWTEQDLVEAEEAIEP